MSSTERERMAALIREVDGDHTLGAAALADALLSRGVSLSGGEGGVREAAQQFVDDLSERQGVRSRWVPMHHFIVGVHQADCKFCALCRALATPVRGETR